MKYEFEACKQYNVNVRKIKQLLNELKLEKSGKTCNSIVVCWVFLPAFLFPSGKLTLCGLNHVFNV